MTKAEIRRRFREAVFTRDGYRCRVCGCNDAPLDAHHITPRENLPAGGYVAENGIALCDRANGCHRRAESGELKPEQLYAAIGSSYARAHEKSVELFARQVRG